MCLWDFADEVIRAGIAADCAAAPSGFGGRQPRSRIGGRLPLILDLLGGAAFQPGPRVRVIGWQFVSRLVLVGAVSAADVVVDKNVPRGDQFSH